SRFAVEAAVSPGTDANPSPSLQVLRNLPDLSVRPTNFGPSLTGTSRLGKLKSAAEMVPAAASLAGLVAHIRRRGIRIIHASDRPRDAIACVLLARAAGVRSVVHVHVKCDTWMGRGVRFAFRSADAVIAISRHVERSFDTFSIPPARRHIVLNAIQPDDWDPGIDGRPVRDELRIPADAPVITCVARLFHWKGQDRLLRAFALVRQEFPAAHLLIVGAEDGLAGSDRPNFLAELKALAQELRLADHVHFTGKRGDVPRLLAASDVFAMPSFEEPFGLVYAEAMAMKRPVVALDNGGTPEVVDHGKSGLLSSPDDLPALAANLLTLLRDPALRARMGEYGRKQVELRFSPDRMARDMAAVYDRLA
ncbi:MAG TPA: glycosyltransferase family 4 protein, partial [Polyangia bacterium]|nr:glycosyltransferase family 4 protein [Polyangia bacterium]